MLSDPGQLRFFFNSYLVVYLGDDLHRDHQHPGWIQLKSLRFPLQENLELDHYRRPVSAADYADDPIFRAHRLAPPLQFTYVALVLTYMVFTLSYAIIMMTGYFNTLPRDLDEAVMIDGGGSFVTLWRILVPISLPGIVAVGVYTFMLAWNEFLFALTLTRTNDMRTVPIGIHLLMGQHSFEWNQMLALSVLGSLPVLILFLLFQRYFIAGMSAGSIKG